MSVERSKSRDYKSLSSLHARAGGELTRDRPSTNPRSINEDLPPQEVANLYKRETSPDALSAYTGDARADRLVSVATPGQGQSDVADIDSRSDKRKRRVEKDNKLLNTDHWLVRNGHFVTYIGLYLFSILVLFRPYELIGALSFLSSTAFYFAFATLLIFLPSQFATEGNFTMMSTEVKAILVLTVLALFSVFIAKDSAVAWDKFNDPYIKAVVIFVVLVNVVRTRSRLMGMMWLSLGIGVYLGFTALDMYLSGQFTVEDYRVGVNVGGMFGNPNEMALHFVMMTPIAIALGIGTRNKLLRMAFFGMAALFVAANMVTFSRGGFLGLLATSGVLAWKLGRKYRLNVTVVSILVGIITMIAAPGNYGLRMLSIFVPSLDPVGSSDQRRELLERSLLVTARNPWGIGIGNFPIVGFHNLQTHNAFTQVSSELGLLGLAVYLIFMISPFRKLGAIERTQFEANDHDWFYYLAIGLQASIVGYMVGSFFASVAYNWFIYYLIAYAVAFRRIYSIDHGSKEDVQAPPLWHWQPAEAK
jgi:putative inorganic carbon (HCO3(-)) transporter